MHKHYWKRHIGDFAFWSSDGQLLIAWLFCEVKSLKCNKKFVGTKSLHIFSKNYWFLTWNCIRKLLWKFLIWPFWEFRFVKKILSKHKTVDTSMTLGWSWLNSFAFVAKKVNFRQIMASLFTFINSGKNFTFYMTVVDISI